MKAIVLPYCVGQNEPSRPLKQVFDLPESTEDQLALFKPIILEQFGIDDGDEDDYIVKIDEGRVEDYGDLIISIGDDLFLFITFITE